MNNLLALFENSTISSCILVFTELIAIIVKFFFLYHLLKNFKKVSKNNIVILALGLIIVSEILCDLCWFLIVATRDLHLLPIYNYLPIIRFAWALCFLEYYVLSLFIEYLVLGKFRFPLRQILCGTATIAISIYYLLLSIFPLFFNFFKQRTFLELMGMKFFQLFIFIAIIPSVYFSYKYSKNNHFPKILAKQLNIFLFYLIIPKLIIEVISINPFSAFFPLLEPIIVKGNYAFVAISTIIMTYGLYYCAKKMMGLRFLNVHKHVQSHEKFNFIDDFKLTLEQLSHVTTMQELKHITQNFFKEAFNVPGQRVMLFIRPLDVTIENSTDRRNLLIENTISQRDSSLMNYLLEQKIFIADEIEFTHFYENNETTAQAIQWLKAVDSDIFLPIYERGSIVGYILIERNARPSFYTRIERDEMLVFASYLSNLLYLLRHRNLDHLLETEHKLKEEIYQKHQEINQYKESIRSFTRSKERKIGIIFYKHRKFTYGNQSAQELLGINLQETLGHPITQALKKLAHDTQQFKSAQTVSVKDQQGNKLVLSAIPSLEDYLIIMVYYPELSDLMKDKLATLQDPSDLDYVLYLETTSSGKLINSLIPGSGETLLQFKINLLKMALSKKALLISMPQDLLCRHEGYAQSD